MRATSLLLLVAAGTPGCLISLDNLEAVGNTDAGAPGVSSTNASSTGDGAMLPDSFSTSVETGAPEGSVAVDGTVADAVETIDSIDARDGFVPNDAFAIKDASISDTSLNDASEMSSHDAGAADATPGVNIIANPSCASGASHWTTFASNGSTATLSGSTSVHYDGTSSCEVSNRTASFQGLGQDIRALAVPGQTYVVSAWALLGGSGPQVTDPAEITVTYTCGEGDAGAVSYVQVGSVQANATTWSEVTGTFTVPTCALSQLYIYVEGPPSGINLYVDDMSVVGP